jgi:hypothetical protein
MLSEPATIFVLAAVVAGFASYFRLSAWWLLVPGTVAAAIAAPLHSTVSACHAPLSTERVFGEAIVVAIAFGGATSLTALFNAIRLARADAKRRTVALQVVPFLVGAAFAVGCLVLGFSALIDCLR